MPATEKTFTNYLQKLKPPNNLGTQIIRSNVYSSRGRQSLLIIVKDKINVCEEVKDKKCSLRVGCFIMMDIIATDADRKIQDAMVQLAHYRMSDNSIRTNRTTQTSILPIKQMNHANPSKIQICKGVQNAFGP